MPKAQYLFKSKEKFLLPIFTSLTFRYKINYHFEAEALLNYFHNLVHVAYRLMLFKEIIAIHVGNHAKFTNAKAELLTVKACSIH